MSLISDALRKARQEAADREAKERGLESPIVAGYWKRGGHLGAGLLLGAAIAVAAALIGGGVVWWIVADTTDSVTSVEALDREGQEPTPNNGTVLNQASMERGPGNPSGEDNESWVEQPQLATADDAGSLATLNDQAADTVAVLDQTPDQAEADSAPAKVSPTPNSGHGNTTGGEYVAEAKIGDVTLILDYLLYRVENPFAQINGRDVRVGSVVEGFVVVEITEDRVILTREDTTVNLRVR